jgi:hypothetical protein
MKTAHSLRVRAAVLVGRPPGSTRHSCSSSRPRRRLATMGPPRRRAARPRSTRGQRNIISIIKGVKSSGWRHITTTAAATAAQGWGSGFRRARRLSLRRRSKTRHRRDAGGPFVCGLPSPPPEWRGGEGATFNFTCPRGWLFTCLGFSARASKRARLSTTFRRQQEAGQWVSRVVQLLLPRLRRAAFVSPHFRCLEWCSAAMRGQRAAGGTRGVWGARI